MKLGAVSACAVLGSLLLAGLWTAPAEAFAAPVRLPVEVVGPDGTAVETAISVPAGRSGEVRSLWMRIHGLEYADLASVRVNRGPWVALNNQSVAVAEPGKSYGGIGGGFSTLKLTLALAPGSVEEGPNTVAFRFNRTDGAVSGFRVLAFNFLTSDGRPVLPAAEFEQDDPNRWMPPLNDARNLAEGERLWRSAALVANGLKGALPIRAHCADCHARDGRDLKYFNYSNASIEARSRFHGLSQHEGEQIASYIRALLAPNPGRPWNPPYQPGPGQAHEAAPSRAAGAGLDWVLDDDTQTLRYLFPAKTGGLTVTPAAFAPDRSLDPREIPIALPLPDWNHWLPRIHPVDAWGAKFENSEFSRLYATEAEGQVSAGNGMSAFFEKWLKAREAFLPHPASNSNQWSAELTRNLYAAQLWQLTKSWEMTQERSLEASATGGEGERGKAGLWANSIPAATAPAATGIPDGPNGMGGSALANEYYNNGWYELQLLLNGGNHRHRDRWPVDWLYVTGRFLDLEKQSGRAEPARLLVATVAAMQSADPGVGPENRSEGWRPDRIADPRILVSPRWSRTFEPLPGETRRAIAEAFLAAWIEKNAQYPLASYFHRAQLEGAYTPPENLREISGGRAWEAAAQFRALGVNPAVVRRLEEWGKEYETMAGLFHY